MTTKVVHAQRRALSRCAAKGASEERCGFITGRRQERSKAHEGGDKKEKVQHSCEDTLHVTAVDCCNGCRQPPPVDGYKSSASCAAASVDVTKVTSETQHVEPGHRPSRTDFGRYGAQTTTPRVTDRTTRTASANVDVPPCARRPRRPLSDSAAAIPGPALGRAPLPRSTRSEKPSDARSTPSEARREATRARCHAQKRNEIREALECDDS